jgi:uncharacterized protein YecT (DUF1311 family)
MNSVVTSLMLSAALLVAAQAAPSAQNVDTSRPACRQDEKVFRGKCVAQDECCVSGVCKNDEVFEFGADGPRCVPCRKAETQQAMNFCAGAATTVAEHDLDVEYRACLARFPEWATRITAVEKTWQTFRDRYCALEAGEYEGGSMQAQVLGECRAREARMHLERLRTLRTEWSKH